MNTTTLSYSSELKRKAIHLSALAIPIGLLIVGRTSALWILVPIAVVALIADIAHQRLEVAHRLVVRCFQPLMRPAELPPFGGPLVLNGATWMCVSATLCVVFYAEPVAAAALIMLMLGDAAAAIIGRRFGRHRFSRSDKSWESSIAFFGTALLAAAPLALPGLMNGLGYLPLSVLHLGVGALIASTIEALPLPLDDNVRVPLLAGLAMTLL